jgi:Amt family ammonium transporter
MSLFKLSTSISRAWLALGVALAPAIAFAQEATAPAATAPAAPVPSADKGDTTWMLISTILVIMMTIPGLGLFYGGLVRTKNVLSILMQVLAGFAIVGLLWVVYGYSFAFTGPADAASATALSPFFGNGSKMFFSGITPSSLVETFSKGVFIPELTFAMFQLTFAAITPALIIGACAERVKFSAMMLFIVIWFTFSYIPVAHMVWFWGGPSAYSAPTGFLFGKGAIDFAGGTVVHINAGIAGLVLAIISGKRVGFGKENMAPHNLVLTYIGAMLLWVGWYGFNAGSNLEANGYAAQAILNTTVATMAAALAWPAAEWITRGHASLLGGASGAIAGLVAITPASGFAGALGAIVIGLVAGAVCYWASSWLKSRLGYDDSLDVFGVHGVGGIIGALMTGIVVNVGLGGMGVVDYSTDPAGTVVYDFAGQMTSQIWGVVVTVIWTGVVSIVAAYIVKATIGLRHPEVAEREGLDITDHGERAYNS